MLVVGRDALAVGAGATIAAVPLVGAVIGDVIALPTASATEAVGSGADAGSPTVGGSGVGVETALGASGG